MADDLSAQLCQIQPLEVEVEGFINVMAYGSYIGAYTGFGLCVSLDFRTLHVLLTHTFAEYTE